MKLIGSIDCAACHMEEAHQGKNNHPKEDKTMSGDARMGWCDDMQHIGLVCW